MNDFDFYDDWQGGKVKYGNNKNEQ